MLPHAKQPENAKENLRKIPCHYYFHLKNCKNSAENCHYSHDPEKGSKFPKSACHLCPKTSEVELKFNKEESKGIHIDIKRPVKPCHYYHLDLEHPPGPCSFHHIGIPKMKCVTESCGLCIPCHYYHCRLPHILQECKFAHTGEPVGSCIRKNCPFCPKNQRIACHFFHLNQGLCPYRENCKFSHSGDPIGKCPTNDCPNCFKGAQKNEFEKLAVELPRWAMRKFYGIYSKKFQAFKDAQLITGQQAALLQFPKGESYSDNIKQVWENYVNEFKANLTRLTIAWPIPNTTSFAILKSGLEVVEILSPGEFNTIEVMFPSKLHLDAVMSALQPLTKEDLESVNLQDSNDKTICVLKFLSKQQAMKFPAKVNYFCKPIYPNVQNSISTTSIEITFSTRRSMGRAEISFKSEISLEQIRKKIEEQEKFIIDKTQVLISFQAKSIVINGLGHSTGEKKLKEWIKPFIDLKELKNISLLRGNASQFDENELPKELRKMSELFYHPFYPEKTKIQDVYKYTIIIKKREYLNVIYSHLKEMNSLYNCPIEYLQVVCSRNIPIYNSIYKVFYTKLKELKANNNADIEKNHHIKIRLQREELDDTAPSKKLVTVYRKIKNEAASQKLLEESWAHLEQYDNIIANIIKGTPITIDQKDMHTAYSSGMLNFYRELARDQIYFDANKQKSTLYIDFSKMQKQPVVYHVDPKVREEIAEKINSRIKRLTQLGNDFDQISNHFIPDFRNLMRKQYGQEYTELIHFDEIKDALYILAQDEKKQEIKAMLEKFKKPIKKQVREDTCEICLTYQASYKGFFCNHRFCIKCLENYISEIVKKKDDCEILKCPNESCSSVIHIIDIDDVVNSGDKLDMIQKNVKKFVAQHRLGYFWCDKCSNLLKIESSIQNTKGPNNMDCDQCNKRFCVKKKEADLSVTVEIHKAHNGPCDDQIEEFEEKHLPDCIESNNKIEILK